MEPGGVWWTNVLNLALPPQRHRPDTRTEHEDPVSHMALGQRALGSRLPNSKLSLAFSGSVVSGEFHHPLGPKIQQPFPVTAKLKGRSGGLNSEGEKKCKKTQKMDSQC